MTRVEKNKLCSLSQNMKQNKKPTSTYRLRVLKRNSAKITKMGTPCEGDQ